MTKFYQFVGRGGSYKFKIRKCMMFSVNIFKSQVLGDRIPSFFVKKKFPVFFFLFGIFVINLCYIIREISLFHIIREISLFPQVYYPAPATININIDRDRGWIVNWKK
jgi:hypothetical protein